MHRKGEIAMLIAVKIFFGVLGAALVISLPILLIW